MVGKSKEFSCNLNSFFYVKNLQIYSILLLFFVGVQELVALCPPPQGEALQSFCGAALRAQINEPPANLTDLVVVGDNLQWYSDAGGTTPIPNTTPLVDGQTYYVSQTTTGTQGCESSLLAVQAVEKYCNCVPNGGFERDATTSTASGYSFAYYDFPVNPPGMQQCQTDLNSIPLQNLTSLDPVNGYNNPTNFLNSRAYILTPGPDSFMSGSSTTQIRVEPNTPHNQRAMGFNDLVAIGNLIVMSKEIIAGQSFSFDYALGMEDATNTNLPPIELPFLRYKYGIKTITWSVSSALLLSATHAGL